MTAIKCLIKAAFTCPAFILFILGGISFAALSAALISQYFFGLYPCELCIYQRIPYAVVVLLAIFGYAAAKMMSPKFGIFNIALCGIAFLINSGIAFYHVGVEQHWWVSGCSMPDFQGLSVDEIREKINAAPNVRCDEIPWEMFGISMAGYNVMICFGLGIYSLIASRTAIKASSIKKCEPSACCCKNGNK